MFQDKYLEIRPNEAEATPFIGVYDAFSASLAARHFQALFVSGFGFAASHYGLPDIGFIAWTDIVAFVQRLRGILPTHRILVDIDDGYGDPEVVRHVTAMLEGAGASGVVMEDQARPRRCGHVDGKLLVSIPEYLKKLEAVLATRKKLFVVARTDASDLDDIIARVSAYAEAGADAILVDGIKDLEMLRRVRQHTGRPLFFNQIAGGKSPPATLQQLHEHGVSFVIYSTPCLFSAQSAIDSTLRELKAAGGRLTPNGVGVPECNSLLDLNLANRRNAGKPASD
jgi:2-methylisocitrate lyase-like PEP mutase family enzyme